MIYLARIFFIVFSCAEATTVVAETLYKSVNDKGEVTFSDSPPENAERVEQIEVQPAPTEQQQQESMQREKRIEEQANEIGNANDSRAEERAAAEPQEVPEAVEPVESYNRVYNNEPAYNKPVRPVQPLPGRPVNLPANRPANRPAPRPAR
jgi:hypothetical protein